MISGANPKKMGAGSPATTPLFVSTQRFRMTPIPIISNVTRRSPDP